MSPEVLYREGGGQAKLEVVERRKVHQPVLYQEVLEWLKPVDGGRYIDATVGGGGHAWGILDRSSPGGVLLGLDRDPQALEVARLHLAGFPGRVVLRQGSFRSLESLLTELGWGQVDGVLFDLGLSSLQLGEAARGFSFQEDGPLDMRFDPGTSVTAEDLVNTLPEEELARLLFVYGEERMNRAIARAIVQARPHHSTVGLAAVVERCMANKRSSPRRPWRIHPATRTFQALRIAVNGELQALEEALPQAGNLLRPGGRLAVISFHSLEDRIVKQFLRRCSLRSGRKGRPAAAIGDTDAEVLFEPTPKLIRPSEEEQRANPRSRSAKLRVAQRIDGGRSIATGRHSPVAVGSR